ncbi:hypothetical protein LTSEURB_3192, partial [Salmonella enterica subsp. enterica serovar Urbana str. R8-2977]
MYVTLKSYFRNNVRIACVFSSINSVFALDSTFRRTT